MNKIELKQFYDKLRVELEFNNNGIAGASYILKELLPNHEVKIDSFSHMIDRRNFVLISYIKDLLSDNTLDVEDIDIIKEEYSDYEYILPTNDINILITEEEICIYQVVEIYLPEGDFDIYKVKLY